MLFRSDRKSTRLNSSHTIISYALPIRSEEHTSELQSHDNLVCRLLLEKKERRSEEHTSELQSHDNIVCRLLLAQKPRARLPHRQWHVAVRPVSGGGILAASAIKARPTRERIDLLVFLNQRPPPKFPPLPLQDALPL